MAKQVEEQLISVTVFCERKLSTNKHYAFHLIKKFYCENHTESEWIEIAKEESIEL